jgi:hypothetical protein
MFVIDPTALSPDVVSAVAAIGGAIVVKLLEYAVNKKDQCQVNRSMNFRLSWILAVQKI